MAKENDGKGARRALVKRGTTCLLLVTVILFALFLLGVIGGGEETRVQRALRDHQHRRGQRSGDGIIDMLHRAHHGGKEDHIHVDLEHPVQEELDPLLTAYVHLVDINSDPTQMIDAPGNSYAGVTADFCRLKWGLHKEDPSSVPMFRHLVDASPKCKNGKHYRVDLKGFTRLARKYDARHNKALNITGVVFHESRCGSTLVANALAAMNPAENRVYSESAPPIAALKSVCGDTYQYCSVHQAGQVLADVMYLMSRSDDPREKRVFFKIQSIGSRNIEVFQNAFPQTPWVFVYRDPVQVMMSQLKMGARNANCVRMRVRPNAHITKLAEKKGLTTKELSDEQYCAAHLATITESAVTSMQREPHLGTPVNYVNLPHVLYDLVLPQKFGVALSEEEIANIKKISGVYSKGTGGRQGEYKDDTEEKEHLATKEVRDAAQLFLDESYRVLEGGGVIKKMIAPASGKE